MKLKRINQIFMVVICAILLLTPYTTYATNTGTGENVGETNPEETEQEKNEGEEGTEDPETETDEGEEDPTGGETGDEETETPKVSIELTCPKSPLKVGEDATITAKVTGSEDYSITWSTEKEDIATVTGNNESATIKPSGVGTTKITAKIDETTSKSCTVTVEAVKVEIEKGTDATLKDVTISNGTLDKSFKSDVYKYSVTVDSDVNSLKFDNLKNSLNDSKAGYHVTGNSNLKNGDVVKILVTAEDEKTQKTYEFTIVKDSVKLGLKSLKINGYALNEEFDTDTLNYTADIPNEIDTITVEAKAEDSDNKVTIKGGTNLKVGENTVTITVKNDDGDSKVYKIIVTRSEESEVEENPTSIITSSNIIDTLSDKDNNSNTPNSTSGEDNFLKYFIVSIACLILFAIGGIGIYFYIQTSPRKLKKELVKMKQTKEANQVEESPIVVVDEPQKTNIVLDDNIEVIPSEELEITKEYKIEELNPNNNSDKLENLFDDSEDV